MSALLITRPNHDLGMTYLYYWSKQVIETAEKKSVKILDLKGNKADIKNLTSYAKKNNPSIFFLNGHGTHTTILGQNDKVLLNENTNKKVVTNRIIYARSCSAGAILGGLLIKKGCKAFIGYANSFVLAIEKDKKFRPLKDQIAKRFLEPSNLIITSILKGNSIGKAHEKSKKEMKKSLDYFLSSDADCDERSAAPWMLNNISCQVLLGDKEAKSI